MDCMAAISKAEALDMSAPQQDSMCQREKLEIKRILDSNQMTMSQIVRDRVNVIRALEDQSPTGTYVERKIKYDVFD